MKRVKEKRGQVTFFLIIAIILVALMILLVYLRPSTINNIGNQNAINSIDEVKSNIQDCLGSSLNEAIFLTSLQGGYYNINPNKSADYVSINLGLFGGLPYYINENKENIPGLNTVSDQISIAVKAKLGECLTAYSLPYDVQYDINNIIVESHLKKGKVTSIAKVQASMIIKNSESKIKNKFNTEIKTDYFDFYLLAVEITKLQMDDLSSICVSCISDLAAKYNIKTSASQSNSETGPVVIYYLYKLDSGEEPVKIYYFVHKFKKEEDKI